MRTNLTYAQLCALRKQLAVHEDYFHRLIDRLVKTDNGGSMLCRRTYSLLNEMDKIFEVIEREENDKANPASVRPGGAPPPI